MRWIAIIPSLSYTPVTLFVVNLLPLVYVLFFDWKVVAVIALYWMENIIVGIINVPKIVTVMVNNKVWRDGLMIPVFIGSYGIFALFQGMFVYTLFESGIQVNEAGQRAFYLFPWLWEQPLFLSGLVGLFFHHFASYLIHFIGMKEYKERDMGELMDAAFDRMAALHAVVLFGGFMLDEMGGPMWSLAFLVGFKIYYDLVKHIKSHTPIMVEP